jgi:hypothetical protein
MRNPRFSWVIFCAVVAAASGCRASSQSWDGTWKLNLSKSSFRNPVFIISLSADGEYRYDDGNSSYTFRCDGKDRPMGNNRTQACVKSSPTVLTLTRKENGVKSSAHRWELSDDGKSLTSTVTAFRPGGPVTTGRFVAWRTSSSNDFAGQWRDTTYLQRHDQMTLRLDSRVLHIGYASGGEYVDAPLDGVDAVVHGPYVLEGVTNSIKPAGQHKFLIQSMRNGEVLTQGFLELSNDGRAITDSWWNPGKPADKDTLVYEKK